LVCECGGRMNAEDPANPLVRKWINHHARECGSTPQEEPAALYPASAPRCSECGRQFSPQEARAGFTTCEYCS
jgi:hypothetical protein